MCPLKGLEQLGYVRWEMLEDVGLVDLKDLALSEHKLRVEWKWETLLVFHEAERELEGCFLNLLWHLLGSGLGDEGEERSSIPLLLSALLQASLRHVFTEAPRRFLK